MLALVINLPSAEDRWAWIEQLFSTTNLTLHRIEAIDGRKCQLPHPDFAEKTFRRIHGRTTNLSELGCYLSHIAAMRAFLETNEKHALICEDDIALEAGFEQVLERAMGYARHWNILRLAGLSQGVPVKVAQLDGSYSLNLNFGRMKGAGAYVLDRNAAEKFSRHLLPMKLPYDHAFDREWFYGLRALCVLPFPVSQTRELFRSSIQNRKARRLSTWRRAFTTYPYQVGNELSRWTFRSLQYVTFRFARSSSAAF